MLLRIRGFSLPGLNASRGLIRAHYHERRRQQEKVADHLRACFPDGRVFPFEHPPVRVWYRRRSIRLMDWDNACASFKLVGDALVDLGILPDDSPEVIADFRPAQLRVRHRPEVGCDLVLEPMSVSPVAPWSDPEGPADAVPPLGFRAVGLS